MRTFRFRTRAALEDRLAPPFYSIVLVAAFGPEGREPGRFAACGSLDTRRERGTGRQAACHILECGGQDRRSPERSEECQRATFFSLPATRQGIRVWLASGLCRLLASTSAFSSSFALLWSAAVLCSAAFVSRVSPLFFWGVESRRNKQKQKRQSKALPHSRVKQKRQRQSLPHSKKGRSRTQLRKRSWEGLESGQWIGPGRLSGTSSSNPG